MKSNITAIVTVTLLLSSCSENKVLAATDIFHIAIESVVELKASSEEEIESYGTAVFISNDGLLITNAHAVTYTSFNETNAFDKCEIRFATEEAYKQVNLLYYDETLDLAILKYEHIEPTKGMIMGDINNIEAGNTVYSIGNGLNHGISITKGIISIPRLRIEYGENIREVIKCDLSISKGNSGGALVDEKGELIGITSFRLRDDFGDVEYGTSYCIPIDVVKNYVSKIINVNQNNLRH